MASFPCARERAVRWWQRSSCLQALVVVYRCGGGGEPDPGPGGPDASLADAAGGYSAEVLRTESYTARGRNFAVTLARITRPDGGRTYVQWIPSDRPPPRPAVVATLPYAGIDWTGEELDQRWATYRPEPSGLYLDVDGPGFDGASEILYEPTTVTATSNGAISHLLNDFSTLFIFGRFYAGGSVRDEIEDMRAGMWFLAGQPAVDRSRVGAIGGSWGGFEALYAATSTDVPLAAIAALFPSADLPAWVDHARTRQGAALTFVAPYLQRIFLATGGPVGAPGADYSGLRTVDLCASLPDQTLVLHDELDNLAPIAESEALRSMCGADAVYWRRAEEVDPTALTHGPLTSETPPASMYTYALAYLHLRLATPGQAVAEGYRAAALAEHLATVRGAQLRSEDVSFAAPRLHELCDPRLYLVDPTTGAITTGAAAVATAVNATWGTRHTAATIRDALALGLPAP